MATLTWPTTTTTTTMVMTILTKTKVGEEAVRGASGRGAGEGHELNVPPFSNEAPPHFCR